MPISSFAAEAVTKTKQALVMSNEKKEENKIIKLIDFYENYQISDEYLANWGFKSKVDGKLKIPLSNINITKQIIDKISLLYKREPERKLISVDDKTLTEEQENLFNKWTTINKQYDRTLKYAERYKKLLHKILYRMTYNSVARKWEFFVDTQYKSHFRGFDKLHPWAYSIRVDTEQDNERWYLFMSDDETFFYQPDTEKKKTAFMFPDGSVVDYGGENPYKTITAVEFRSEPAITQYGTSGAIDLVNSNQAINIALNNIHISIQYQSFGIVWQSGNTNTQNNTVTISPFTVYSVDSGESLNNLNLNPAMIESMETIYRHIKLIGNAYGVNINFSVEASPVSGVSLVIQNIDLLEKREDDIDIGVDQENEIYKKLVIMQNYHANELPENEPKLIDNVTVSINYTDLDFPVNLDDDLKERDWYITNNIKTPLDYMDPDLDENAKLKEFNKNKKINGQLTSFDELAAGLNPEGVIPNEEQV